MLLICCSTEATSPQKHSHPRRLPGRPSPRLCRRPSPRQEDTPSIPIIIPSSLLPSTCCLPPCQPMEQPLPHRRITRTWSATTQTWTTRTTTSPWRTIVITADVVRHRVTVGPPRLHCHQQPPRSFTTPALSLSPLPLTFRPQHHGQMAGLRRRLPRPARRIPAAAATAQAITTPVSATPCRLLRFFPTAVIIQTESTIRQRRSRSSWLIQRSF